MLHNKLYKKIHEYKITAIYCRTIKTNEHYNLKRGKRIMNEQVSVIEKRILEMLPLERRDVISWANQKLREAIKKETTKYFESILYLLPKAVILSFGIDYRCVIFQITHDTYVRVSEGIPKRHLKDRSFPREEMPPPIKELVENKKIHSIYIKNALTDERTQYMKDLVINTGIKDIYYTKVITPSGIWILVVDGTTKTINGRKKEFLDMLGFVIQNIEVELAEIRTAVKENSTETKIGVTTFLIELLHDKLGNKAVTIEGLINRINKIAKSNGSSNRGNCHNCQKKIEAIVKDSSSITKILKILGEILHDIKQAEKLNIENVPFSQIFNELVEIDREALIELNNPTEEDFIISTDERKSIKAICRIIDQLIQRNKNPIKLSISRLVPGKIKLLINQQDINTKKLEMLINVSPDCKEITDHSFEDFKVFVSATLFSEMDTSLTTNPDSVEIIFPEKTVP